MGFDPAVAHGQEASNLTAAHWLYAKGANVEVCWDAAHGSWNDIERASSDTSNYAWLLSLLLTWNIPHGPWSEASRASQCREAIAGMVGKEWEEVAPLFSAKAFEMLRERGECGRLADETVLQDMWQEFRTTNAFVNKGCKVSLNRFMSLVKTGRFEKRVWAMRTLVYEYVCLCLSPSVPTSKNLCVRPATRSFGCVWLVGLVCVRVV